MPQRRDDHPNPFVAGGVAHAATRTAAPGGRAIPGHAGATETAALDANAAEQRGDGCEENAGGAESTSRRTGNPSIVLILPYFGSWPSYMDLWLRSCLENHNVNWLVISDCDLPSEPPPNLRHVRSTLSALADRISDVVGMRVCLPRPYKLCDFKPAFGDIFADEIRGFDFWGHCDADLLFGSLRSFLSCEIFSRFDKVLIRGWLAFYRNCAEANAFYRLTAPGIDYRQAFTDPRSVLFDEFPGMARILEHHAIPYFHDEIGADIDPFHHDLRMMQCRNYRHQAFAWEHGEVWQYYWDGQAVRRRSFPLIHMQKRRMLVPDPDLQSAPGWYILPDKFVPKVADPYSPQDLRRLNPRAPLRDLTRQVLRPYRRLQRLARERSQLHAAPRGVTEPDA